MLSPESGPRSYAANSDHISTIIMGKQPIIETRITVEMILEKLAAGETVDQILSEHPRLTVEGIRAAIAFAAEVLLADVVYPVETVAA